VILSSWHVPKLGSNRRLGICRYPATVEGLHSIFAYSSNHLSELIYNLALESGHLVADPKVGAYEARRNRAGRPHWLEPWPVRGTAQLNKGRRVEGVIRRELEARHLVCCRRQIVITDAGEAPAESNRHDDSIQSNQ
jgi:hypothetical protein